MVGGLGGGWGASPPHPAPLDRRFASYSTSILFSYLYDTYKVYDPLSVALGLENLKTALWD